MKLQKVFYLFNFALFICLSILYLFSVCLVSNNNPYILSTINRIQGNECARKSLILEEN